MSGTFPSSPRGSGQYAQRLIAAALLSLVAMTCQALAEPTPQRTFATPQAAVDALVAAVRSDRTAD
ncbi:MAG TPA: hypothetical protein VK433_01810, partial [Stellaceae bacterium]|nr:hypothetical protein [Stellaceae bacterium]